MRRERRPVVVVLTVLGAVVVGSTGALRYENIRDEEVREIQRVVAGIVPGELVQIGGVSEGCACEETAACTAQVRVTVLNPSKTIGLQLSRLEGHWAVGELQNWEFRYQDLLASYQKRFDAARGGERERVWHRRTSELAQLMAERPVCSAPKAV